MHKYPMIALLSILAFTAITCATVVTNGIQTVPVITNPEDAKVSVYDSNNMLVFEAFTPCNIILKKKSLIGSRLTISKPGYRDIEVKIGKRVDFCFYGNACIGFIPGIVDIINGNWMEADINGLLVRLEEVRTVYNTDKNIYLMLSHAGSEAPGYSFVFQKNDEETCIVNIVELKDYKQSRLY